jgi:hypothetical protein
MKNIIKSLALFHKEMSAVKEDGKNPHFGSRYATLDNILEAIKGPMDKAGLAFVQIPLEGGKLRTVLFETETGESIEGTMDLFIAKQDPQGQGSGLTYARRYALSAMLGISTDTDDDGNAATTKPAQPVSQPISKICTECKQLHTGPYPKCLQCYNKTRS